MPRRVALPGADELFRSTGSVQRPSDDMDSDADQLPSGGTATATEVVERPVLSAPPVAGGRPNGPRRPSGRQRHEEKITVYVSPSELVDLEHARLVLRAE